MRNQGKSPKNNKLLRKRELKTNRNGPIAKDPKDPNLATSEDLTTLQISRISASEADFVEEEEVVIEKHTKNEHQARIAVKNLRIL